MAGAASLAFVLLAALTLLVRRCHRRRCLVRPQEPPPAVRARRKSADADAKSASAATTDVELYAAAAAEAPIAVASAAVVWEVRLEGVFQPYSSDDVAAIERAYSNGDESVGVRDGRNEVRLKPLPFVQRARSGHPPCKEREVRRRRVLAAQPAPANLPMGQRVQSSVIPMGQRVLATEEELCAICLDGARTHAFVPCGHRALCSRCSETNRLASLEGCPICRARFERVLRVFA